jgi:hypothetical protein
MSVVPRINPKTKPKTIEINIPSAKEMNPTLCEMKKEFCFIGNACVVCFIFFFCYEKVGFE